MIFYFTGTGNSLWAAKEIGKELNQPVENIIKTEKQKSNFFLQRRYNRFCLSYLHERSAMDCKRIFIEVNGQS